MKRLLLLGLLCACSRCSEVSEVSEEETEAEAEAETAAEVEAEVVAAPEADTTTPSPPTAEILEEARAAIREGRNKAGAEDFAGALAAFDRALELIPTAARVRCEAGFLAHRAGDHAQAARQIDLALLSMPDGDSVPDAWKAPLAMCLYNRGLVGEALIEEEDGDEDEDEYDLLELYRESLSLRENATVRARMNALEGRLGEDVTPAAGSLQEVIQSVGDVCEGEPNCTQANYLSGVQSADGDDERPCWERRVERDDELGDDRAVMLDVASTECLFDVSTQYLALEGQEHWTAYLLGSTDVANTDSFHREESDDSDRVVFSRVHHTLVRVDYTNIRASHYGSEERDEGEDEEEDAESCYVDNYTRSVTHKLLLCRQDRPHAQCGTIVLGSASGTSWDSSCGGGEPFPPGLEDIDGSLARRVRFEDGFVIVEATDGAPASYDGPEPGRYSLDAFFDMLAEMRPEST